MPDFESMTDEELRKFKNEKYREIEAARLEMRAANVVLERKRAEADADWAAQVKAAGGDVDAVSANVDAPAAAGGARAPMGS